MPSNGCRRPSTWPLRTTSAGSTASKRSSASEGCSMFAPGEHVRTRVMNPSGHTRLPLYLRGRTGRIERVLGTLPFPDRRAGGDKGATETAYTVRLAPAESWDADAEPNGTICADLFDSYLEAFE